MKYIRFFGVFAIIAALTLQVHAQSFLTNGLVAYFPFNGNANDATGNGYNGTVYGATLTADRFGNPNSAYSFDGTSSYIETANELPDMPSATASCWIKVPNYNIVIQGEYILMDGGVTSGHDFQLGPGGNTNIGFETKDNVSLQPPIPPITNTWYQVVAVADNTTSNVLKLWLNGQLLGTTPSLGNANVGYHSPFYIGCRALFQDYHFNGDIDDVRIYNRALSDSEVQQLYAYESSATNRPLITAQPQGQAGFVGGSAAFTVQAVGAPPLSYQWQFNRTNIVAATNATATNATLVLTNLQLNEAGSYSVVITNPDGSTNSSNALLTVNPPPPCTPPPAGLVSWWAAEGNANDTFGTNNGVLVNGVGFAPGEVGEAFSFNGTNQYVSNASPRLTNIVDSYTMEFWANPNAARAVTPEENTGIPGISGQRYAICPSIDPQSTLAGAGVSVGTNGISVFEHAPVYLPSLLVYNAPITGWTHIAVVYSNRQPALYVNGTLVQTGVTSARSSCPSTSLGENDYNYGYYSGLLDEVSIYDRPLTSTEIQAIYAADSAGKCAVPPVIATQPQSATVVAGSTASFSVGAVGSQPLSYQWFVNETNIPTATNAVLVLTNLQLCEAGSYSVVITNQVGLTNSTNAVLTVLASGECDPPPSGLVSWWPAEDSAIDIAGTNNGTLQGRVTFVPGEVGQAFHFDGATAYVSIPASSSLNVGTNGGFTIEGWIQPVSLSALAPLIEWENGPGSLGASFGINEPTVYGGGGPGSLYANLLDITGTGHAMATAANLLSTNTFNHVALTYDKSSGMGTIYLNGRDVASLYLGDFAAQTTYNAIFGYQPPSYYLSGLMDELSLYNRALSSNEIQAIYEVGSAGKCKEPVIAGQPESQVSYWGNNVTLTVNAAGTGPLYYQWEDNNVAIAGQTNASLVLTGLQFTNAGDYTVVISNLYGVATSAPAYLSVNPAGVSLALYPGVTIDGVVGYTYGIQYSTNLSDTNDWLGLTNLTLTQTNTIWFDLQAATLPQRYYRVLPGPISIP